MHVQRSLLLSLLAVCALLGAGCGPSAGDLAEPAAPPSDTMPDDEGLTDAGRGDDHAEPSGDHEEEHDEKSDEHGDVGFAFGAPAEAAEADRTVAIIATDDMAFDPPSVSTQAGEVITFEVTNDGQIPHDFTLGDEHTQREHASEMAAMGADMAHADPNAVTLDPGQTAAVTWRFDRAGEVLYGCHQPGHYDAGMVGVVDVRS